MGGTVSVQLSDFNHEMDYQTCKLRNSCFGIGEERQKKKKIKRETKGWKNVEKMSIYNKRPPSNQRFTSKKSISCPYPPSITLPTNPPNTSKPFSNNQPKPRTAYHIFNLFCSQHQPIIRGILRRYHSFSLNHSHPLHFYIRKRERHFKHGHHFRMMWCRRYSSYFDP